MSEIQEEKETAKAVYNRLKQDRDNYIKRAEACAKVTIPSLFPSNNSSSSESFTTPHQSIGSRGLNNLSNKLLLALFPPNATFFRLSASQEVAAEIIDDAERQKKIETYLASFERIILHYIETNQIRVTVGEGIKQLCVAGNCLLYLPPDGGIKLYRLNNYVVQRDALGTVITIVTLDNIAYAALPVELQSMVEGEDVKPDTNVEVYTHLNLEDGVYVTYQEIDGKIVQGSEGQYPTNNSPWFPLRMVKVDGENYGRSYVEEYIGDLIEADALAKAIGELAALSAFILHLVNPTGLTRPGKLQEAKSGDFVPGREEDIATYQTGKSNDMMSAINHLQNIETRLGYAFMLNSSVQRNGERVTAEEIRYVAGELEDNLGGIYSILTQELQLPLVRRLVSQLQTMGTVKELPEGTIDPQITTGMEALGRGHDLLKLQTFLEFVSTLPDAVGRLKLDGLLTMVGNSLGLDTSSLIKTEDEFQIEMEEAQMLQMAQKAAPHMMEQQQ